MKLFRSICSAAFGTLVASHALQAQSDGRRSWFDLKGAFAGESPGGTTYQTMAGINLSIAGSLSVSRDFALQLVGDYYTGLNPKNESCGVNPFNGGCISGVGGPNFHALGVAASVMTTSSSGSMPTWDASLGAGYYGVGAAPKSALGLRAAVDRVLAGGERNGLVASLGLLVLPMGSGAPISVFTLGLGVRFR